VPVEIVKFIDEALLTGHSALIHSVRGQSRAAVIAILYFLEKYQWTLMKTLEFISSRRPDLEMRANFLAQIQKYVKRKRCFKTGRILTRSDDWESNLATIYSNGQVSSEVM
jgi:protein-tyrosine phosphatase